MKFVTVNIDIWTLCHAITR